ncbi:MAG: ATP-grasp domain-containing protein [Thermoflexales bacterium]
MSDTISASFNTSAAVHRPDATSQKSNSTLRVALLVNLARNAPPIQRTIMPPDLLVELDSDRNVEAYAQALEEEGHEVLVHEGDAYLAQWITEIKPDICFNTCEGFLGNSREAQVPALLEMIGARYTGPTPLAAAITQDKPTTKRILQSYRLPTPPFQVFETPDEELSPELSFPLFVKPIHEGTGMGIHNESIVYNERQLRDRVAWLITAYDQPALIEPFIDGQDLTCGLVGNGQDVHFFPINEVDYSGYPSELRHIYGSLQKVDFEQYYRNRCPAPISEKLADDIRKLTHQTFLATQCRDFARVDFRLDKKEQLHILEINALPGIGVHSDLTLMAAAEGWTHGELVRAVLHAALRRYQML